jgi:hypothetical protein
MLLQASKLVVAVAPQFTGWHAAVLQHLASNYHRLTATAEESEATPLWRTSQKPSSEPRQIPPHRTECPPCHNTPCQLAQSLIAGLMVAFTTPAHFLYADDNIQKLLKSNR